MTDLEKWRSLWQNLGAAHCNPSLLGELLDCYHETQRKYHTTQHLWDCLKQFAKIRGQANYAAEVELALWFHDAIYDVKRHDNEEKSATWAKRSIVDAGLSAVVAQRVYDLVMTTRHDAIPTEQDAKILVDVDLSILGSRPERFEEYECQIRQEYDWVPEAEFRIKRSQLLKALTGRSYIFNTEYFREAYEIKARDNLRRSLLRLDSGFNAFYTLGGQLNNTPVSLRNSP